MIQDWVVKGDEDIYLQNLVWYNEIALVCNKINPKFIVEFGVRYGYSAKVALSNCKATMLGYEGDIDTPTKKGWKHAIGINGFRYNVELINTRELLCIPQADLVLVDADHSYEGACHEIILATRSSPYVLVDDYNNPDVMNAINDLGVEIIEIKHGRIAHIKGKY